MKWLKYKGEWLVVDGVGSASIQREGEFWECFVFKCDDYFKHLNFPTLRQAKEYAVEQIARLNSEVSK